MWCADNVVGLRYANSTYDLRPTTYDLRYRLLNCRVNKLDLKLACLCGRSD